MQAVEATDAAAPAQVDDGRSTKKLGVGFWIAVGFLVVIVLGCVLAPYLSFLKDPRIPDGLNARIVASADHPLGTEANALSHDQQEPIERIDGG